MGWAGASWRGSELQEADQRLGCSSQPRVRQGFHPPLSSVAVMKSSSSQKLLEPGQQLLPPWLASSRAPGSSYACSLPGLEVS